MGSDAHLNKITGEIIGAAIEVHRCLGPGLLEQAYRDCLGHELGLRGVQYYKEFRLPVEYKEKPLERTYSIDLLVKKSVVVEVKSAEALAPIHEAQLLTYLRLGEWKVGLLINFNVEVLKSGIRRRVLDFTD